MINSGNSCNEKRVSSAAECNKQPIVDILLEHIIPTAIDVTLLEIGSGTGQHVVYFAEHFPRTIFQPSDVDTDHLHSIQAYIDDYERQTSRKHILSPLNIDLLAPTTIAGQSFDFVYCCNVIHITPIECTNGLFALAEHVLKSQGSLITYGPYALAGSGRITPESNRQFHQHLQQRDARWGLKSIDELVDIAGQHRMKLKATYDMPSNNKILWWQKI
jgi:SAM-dependent methyltransferase